MDPSLVLNRSRQAPAQETTAFGGIAERFRRAGDLDRAITLCREGLQKFPEHLSARVTLGWALLDQGKYDEAQVELEQVLKRAPDNLAAIRGLAELHERAENAVELSLDGPGPWPPDAEAIKGAAPAPASAVAEPTAAPAPAPAPPRAAAAEPTAPVPAPTAAVAARAVAEPPVASLIETAAEAAMARTADPAPVAVAAPVVAAAPAPAPATAVELKTFADLLSDPALEEVAVATAPVDLGEPNEEALLKALDELEGGSAPEPPAGRSRVAVVDEPVVIEPVFDDLVGALETGAAAVEVVADEPVAPEPAAPGPVAADAVALDAVASDAGEFQQSSPEPIVAATQVDAAVAEVAPVQEPVDAAPPRELVESAPAELVAEADWVQEPVAEVERTEEPVAEVARIEELVAEAAPVEPVVAETTAAVEVFDGFALTAEAPSDAVAFDDAALSIDAEPLGLVEADTNSLSLDFETIPPAPVPVGPSPAAIRRLATVVVLERMLTRVHTRRIEVASEYHLAS